LQRELFLKLIRENENKDGSWLKKNSEAVIKGMEQDFPALSGRLEHPQIKRFYRRSKRSVSNPAPAVPQPTVPQPTVPQPTVQPIQLSPEQVNY
jgi:hypothetical protein